MRIVVTGGAGFIGSNTCESLINDGLEVICLDNFLTGKRENIQHLLSDPNFTLLIKTKNTFSFSFLNCCLTAEKLLHSKT